MPSRNRVSPQAGYIKNPKSDRHPRGPNGRLLCRWCQVEVPKGRRTFCSDSCVHEWSLRSNPAYLREMVFRRDRGVCAECSRDCEALYLELTSLRRADVRQYGDSTEETAGGAASRIKTANNFQRDGRSRMKLAILDRKILMRPKSGGDFPQTLEDQELLPGVRKALERLKAEGYTLAIASNEDAIADGIKSLGDAIDESVFLCRQLLGGMVETVLMSHSYEEKGYGEFIRLELSDDGQFWKIVTNARQRFRKPASGMIDWLCADHCCERNWWSVENFDVLLIGEPQDEQVAIAAHQIRFLNSEEWRNGKAA